MSEFITNSDPIYSHDWKPGRVQAAAANFKERCGRLHTLICDTMESVAREDNGTGSGYWLALKKVGDLVLACKPYEAQNAANELHLEILGLAELAAEDAPLDWGDKADRNMMEYPHQN